MAYGFEQMQVAQIKARSSTDSTETYTIYGVTTAAITPAQAAIQINKMLGIGSKGIIVTPDMKRIITQEAVENG